jgi:hypothetical protein
VLSQLFKSMPTPGVPDPETITDGADKGANWLVQLMENPAGARIVGTIVILIGLIILWRKPWFRFGLIGALLVVGFFWIRSS